VNRIFDDIFAGLYILMIGCALLVLSPIILPAWAIGALARRRRWEWWQ